jgi:hypothetical protein
VYIFTSNLGKNRYHIHEDAITNRTELKSFVYKFTSNLGKNRYHINGDANTNRTELKQQPNNKLNAQQ